MNRNPNTPNTEAISTWPPKRIAKAAAALTLIAGTCGIGGWLATKDMANPAAASASRSTHGLPPDWPMTPPGLPPKACQPGDLIDRQVPQHIGSHVAAVVDSRCEPPRTQPFTNAHTQPRRSSPIVARVFDGQTVKVDCQITGQELGDDRDANFKNDQWFVITFPEIDKQNKPHRGFVAGANLGQLAIGTEVPLCTALSTPSSAIPSHAPSSEAPSTSVPSPTTTDVPTTTPSPTTTMVPSPIVPPSPTTVKPPCVPCCTDEQGAAVK